jgi:hypothetical protein
MCYIKQNHSAPYMGMKNNEAILKQPLWVAALLASADERGTEGVLDHRLDWESGRASLCFINGGPVPVFIPALGVELGAGSRVDVQWPAGATAYEWQVRCAA